MKEIKHWTKWLYWFVFAVAVIFVYKALDNFNNILIVLKNLFSVLMPFIVGSLIAYLLYIPCKSIEKIFRRVKFLNKKARGISIFTVYTMLVLIVAFAINILLPAISESVKDLASNLPVYYQKIMDFGRDMPQDSLISQESIEKIVDSLEKIDITKFLNIETITDYIYKAIGVARAIFSIFVTIIISIYILLERTEILKFIKKVNKVLFKEETQIQMEKYFNTANNIFSKFIGSQIMDGIIVGIITSIAMCILRVKYAVLLGFMIGLFNIIPYFGAIIAVTLAGIITIFTGGIGQAIWMIIVVTILQQIDANIINPKLIKDALKLSRILVVFSVTIGGAYFGFLGMFLAVPVIALIKIFVNDYLEYRIESKT